MPGAIGWAPALLPSRGGVIDAQGSIRDRARCDWEIEEVGEVEEASLLPIVPTRVLRQARSPCEVQVLPPCQFFGHTGMTYGMALELAPHNIRVNCVAPGPVEGERVDRAIEGQASARGISVEQMRK